MSFFDNPVERAMAATAVAFASVGLIDEQRGRETAELAWPRVVTGFARKSQRTADFAMVGIAVGPAGIAGMAFALPFRAIASGFGTSLTNGAISLMAQRFGADELGEMDLAIKQTLWVGTLLGAISGTIYFLFPGELIGLLGAGPEALRHGAVYLQVMAFVIVIKPPTQTASKALLSAGDAWSPMVIRVAGAALNLVLNAIFIFGLDLGVFGAALGTLISSALVTVCLGVGLVRGRFPGLGEFPIRLQAAPPFFDAELTYQLLEITVPLMIRRIVQRAARFPMLLIVAQYGTVIVAAYGIGRQVRGLLKAPNWGFSTAASSLVGQALGGDDEAEAEAYGWDVIRFATAVFVVIAVPVFLLSGQIARLFATDPETIARTTPFVQVAAISVLGLGIDSVSTGCLRAGGDTRWPLYAQLVGLYGFMLPIAYLGLATSWGLLLLYLAMFAETITPGAITFYRYRTGAWKVISREYR